MLEWSRRASSAKYPSEASASKASTQLSKVPLSAKFNAIAAVTGTVAASAAIGRLAATMLDTATTSSIRNMITVFVVTS